MNQWPGMPGRRESLVLVMLDCLPLERGVHKPGSDIQMNGV